MHYLEKSPGMCSDRPGTTPKGLDLVAFPTCLREKERDTFGVCIRFGGGGEGDIQYKSSLADPTILSSRGLSAVLWRTVRLWNFLHCNWLKLPLPNMRGPSAVLWRTVRNEFLRLTTSLQSLWWTSPINGGLSAAYTRTVRATKNLTSLNSANFLNSNSNFGSLLI